MEFKHFLLLLLILAPTQATVRNLGPKLFKCDGEVNWIFLLDESGSMYGTNWNNLVSFMDSAVQRLIPPHNWVCVAKFNGASTTSQIVKEMVHPDPHLNLGLTMWGGGTSFNAALQRANALVNSYPNYNTCVVFVTDGHAYWSTSYADPLKNNFNTLENNGFDTCFLCYFITSGSSIPSSFQTLCDYFNADVIETDGEFDQAADDFNNQI